MKERSGYLMVDFQRILSLSLWGKSVFQKILTSSFGEYKEARLSENDPSQG